MSKTTIIGVIVLMGISLLGMVGLQLYWISDALRVKQEQFDRSVHEALARVVEKLETQEAVSAVASGMATLQSSPPDTPVVAKQTRKEAGAQSISNPSKQTKERNEKPSREIKKKEDARSETTTVANAQDSGSAKLKGSISIRSQSIPITGDRVFYVKQSPIDSLVRRKPLSSVRIQEFPTMSGEFRQSTEWQKVQAQGDSLHAHVLRLNENNALHIRRLTDSLVSYNRQLNGSSFRISMDTLRYIALRMDSLQRYDRLDHLLDPAAIAAINVHKDSLFIIKKSHASREQEMFREMAGKSGGRITFRSVRSPEEIKAAQGAITRIELRPAKKNPPAIPVRAADTQAPTARLRTTSPDPVKLEAKKEKLNDVVEKMVVEYVAKDVPLTQRLNLSELKPLLQNELQNKGVALDFGYWVLSGQQDTVAAVHLPTTGTSSFATYKASLFPNDIFEKPDYLAVYFPDSQAYALKSLWTMLLLSGLFTLVMVATFGTTIHIIFRQKKLSDMKNDFINNMTHEFKTPIATISLATDSIANPKVYGNPDKIKYYTDIIRQENRRMNVQVENVLQIAQLEKNDYRMNLQPVDLHALVGKAVDSIRLQVEERMGTISARLCAMEHELQLDEVHAYNVICNLLDNANKYSPNCPDIYLETQNVAGGVLLAVEDKGMGMTRDTQLRVFEKFYRVPTGNLHNVKGFGLGLSYVKAIVKAHHGNITLQSEPGRGSRFEIFLPFSA